MKKLLFLFLFLIFTKFTFTQVFTWEPEFPTIYDTVTIYYDATLGNGALAGIQPVYAHTGILTSISWNNHDWKNKKFSWPKGDSILEMEYLGNNKHKFKIYPKNFYNIHQSQDVRYLCYVFRNTGGTIVGKNSDGSDFYVPVWKSNQQARFVAPVNFPLTPSQGDQIPIRIRARNQGMINIFHDGNLISQSFTDDFNYTITAGGYGKHWIKFIHQAGGITTADSIFYLVQPNIVVEALPQGIKDGINVIDDNTVVFCLHAPWKQRVYLIGDFNDWQILPEFEFKRTPDGQRWWYKLENLDPSTEYRYQYLVDFDINIADPYAQKLLDPFNDQQIHPVIYPNLISYPTGKTSEMVGVFSTTARYEYEWQITDFQVPDRRDLVIYELLVRDWHIWSSYKTIMDSISYLANLGINAIELMPINEYDGNDSWGYMPAFFFAPDKCYGTSKMLKQFIDVCHQNGIAVILDIVLNHASGQNPMARLYYNKEKFRPTWQNPWFNELIPHPYGYHCDFDHTSPYTQAFVDSVLSYWVTEYKIDGYRLDLSKGFTNDVTVSYNDEGDIIWADVGAWGNYNQWRIDYLKGMANRFWSKHPGKYIILEHLASFWEEKALSDHGFMLWCGQTANEQYAQAGMGYLENSDFKWGVSYQHYQGNNLGLHNLVGYMESHDEERLMYKAITYGNMHIQDGDTLYNIRDKVTALQRMGQLASFFFTVPGPKMFWQFGERGYDYSINWPALDEPGATRTDKKPPRWDYMSDPNRQYLYKVYAALINLKKNYKIFRTSNYEMHTASYDKRIRLWDDGYANGEMQVVVLGNFNVASQNVWPEFSHSGWWYDYFTGDSIYIEPHQTEGQNFTFTYAPGEYHIYTDMRLPKPDLSVSSPQPFVPGITADVYNTSLYPVPFSDELNIELHAVESSNMQILIYNINGQLVHSETKSLTNGKNKISLNLNYLKSGTYFYVLRSGKTNLSGKIIKN